MIPPEKLVKKWSWKDSVFCCWLMSKVKMDEVWSMPLSDISTHGLWKIDPFSRCELGDNDLLLVIFGLNETSSLLPFLAHSISLYWVRKSLLLKRFDCTSFHNFLRVIFRCYWFRMSLVWPLIYNYQDGYQEDEKNSCKCAKNNFFPYGLFHMCQMDGLVFSSAARISIQDSRWFNAMWSIQHLEGNYERLDCFRSHFIDACLMPPHYFSRQKWVTFLPRVVWIFYEIA